MEGFTRCGILATRRSTYQSLLPCRSTSLPRGHRSFSTFTSYRVPFQPACGSACKKPTMNVFLVGIVRAAAYLLCKWKLTTGPNAIEELKTQVSSPIVFTYNFLICGEVAFDSSAVYCLPVAIQSKGWVFDPLPLSNSPQRSIRKSVRCNHPEKQQKQPAANCHLPVLF